MSSALGCADDVEETPATTSEVTGGCTLVSSGSAWWNSSFPAESGTFHVEFTATPSANNIDAVVGLSNGTASNWTKLAAIIRFSPEGIIDVRRGSGYAYSSRNTYFAGQVFNFRIDVNVKAHTYSVYILNPNQIPITVAKDFAFRSEQSTVASLSNIASYLEPSRAGSLNVCGIRVVHDDSFGNDCLTSTAGGAFQNIQMVTAPNVLMARFEATPSANNMDGVVGFGMGTIDTYNKFAASFRFATNGNIEVRDGDTYRADQPYTYRAGSLYRFQVIIDIPSKTYSVRVAQDYYDFVEIARSYKFRPQQAGITAIDHAATVVASSTGRVDACSLRNQTWGGLKFAHNGYASVLPLYNNNLAITNDQETVIANGSGATLYRGAPSGLVAHDNNDNLYIATTSFGWLTVQSFTSTLAPRYTRTYQVDGNPYSMNVWPDGTIAVAVPTRLVTFHPNGSIGATNLENFTFPAVTVGRLGWGVVQMFPDGMQIDSFTTNGDRIFQRFFSGSFELERFVPRMQAFVLAGQFRTTVDFGQGPMEPYCNPEACRNTFLLSLTANGVVGFSQRLWTANTTGLATDDNNYIAVATQDWTQTPYAGFTVYDGSGNALFGHGGGASDDSMGFAGGISVSSSGRAFVNLAPKWYPGASEQTWPHLFAFEAN